MSPIALLSVSDKTGLLPLAKTLINDLANGIKPVLSETLSKAIGDIVIF